MTIQGYSIDGWKIDQGKVDATREKQTMAGDELARKIFDLLAAEDVQISRKRCELILEACKKDEYE